MKTLEKIITLTIFTLGLYGNIICCLIYSGKKFEKISCSFYYRVLSINNILVSLYTLEYFIGFIISDKDSHYIRHLSNIYCKLVTYIEWATLSISTWLMVIILFDRFMTIKFNKKFRFLENFKFKCLMVISIYLAIFCIYIPVAISYKLNPSYLDSNKTDLIYECTKELYIKLISTIDFIFLNTLPFALMIIFSSLSILVIFKSRNRVRNQNLDEHRLKKDVFFALSSIVLNYFYLATNLPITLMEIMSVKFTFLILLLQHFNCAISIFIHLFSNKIFYHEFLRIICINGKISPKSSITRKNTLKDRIS